MDEDLKENLTASQTWIRGLFILLFVFLLVVARIVTGAVVVIQFLFTVFSGQVNENLRYFGASLANYIYQTLLFITYNSDEKPFPFTPWPEPDMNPSVDESDDDADAEPAPALEEGDKSDEKKSTDQVFSATRFPLKLLSPFNLGGFGIFFSSSEI